jgi:CRP/FNR family cyclic AMP-dependent transcriptional regulator
MLANSNATTVLSFSTRQSDSTPNLIPSSTQQSSSGALEIPVTTLKFDEGDVIFRAGETPQGIYMLKSGSVKLSSTRELTRGRMPSPDFVNKVVAPGELFGFKGFVKDTKSPVTAKALKACEIELYSQETILRLMNGPNTIVKRLLTQLLADVESLETVGQLHYLASVQERIAYQLSLLGDKFGVQTAEGLLIGLKLTRNELAQLAGTINESLSRHLTEFKSEGLIELKGKEIIIKDRAGLKLKSGNFK